MQPLFAHLIDGRRIVHLIENWAQRKVISIAIKKYLKTRDLSFNLQKIKKKQEAVWLILTRLVLVYLNLFFFI